MSIEASNINIQQIFQNDKLDLSFELNNVDFTGKTFFCQVRKSANESPVLEFKESDNSIIKTVESSTLTTIRLVRTSKYMSIPAGVYEYSVICYSDENDVETIMYGTFEVVEAITVKP